MRYGISILVSLLVISLSPFSRAQNAPQFPPKTEELQKRVKEFYALLQQGRIQQAEAYVTKDSMETFRMMKINAFTGSELQSIQLDPSGKSADVQVQILYESPMVRGAILKYARQSTWRLEKGEWRMEVVMASPPPAPQPPPGLNQAFNPENLSAGNPPAMGDLQFERTGSDLGVIQEGDKKEVRFNFKNGTDHPVKITSVETGCDCLKVTSGIKSYAPGESGELVLQFNSAGYAFGYKQTVFVKTDPGNQTSYLLVEAKPLPPSGSLGK